MKQAGGPRRGCEDSIVGAGARRDIPSVLQNRPVNISDEDCRFIYCHCYHIRLF